MIAIIDYDAGNIKSVEKALLLLGEEVVLTRDADVLMQAEKVILPGVGAFGDAMDKLKEYGLVDVIKRVVEKGTPFLGICLGLQLLFESSQESPGVEGLEESYVYFVHSYYLKAEEDIVTARTHYGVAIDASVEKGNVFACQFHPEKSSEVGLQILKNFVSIGR